MALVIKASFQCPDFAANFKDSVSNYIFEYKIVKNIITEMVKQCCSCSTMSLVGQP
jgi:hypothetical protein